MQLLLRQAGCACAAAVVDFCCCCSGLCCAGLLQRIKHLALGPDFLILKSDEDDNDFRENNPGTDEAPVQHHHGHVRDDAVLADAGIGQVEVKLVQEGSKIVAKEVEASATSMACPRTGLCVYVCWPAHASP